MVAGTPILQVENPCIHPLTSTGLVTFVHLNTELAVKKGSSQYTWLQSTLRNIDRRVRPWVVVIGMNPLKP